MVACAGTGLALVLLAPWARPFTGLPVPGPTLTPRAGLGGGQIAVSDFFSPLPEGKKGFSAYFLGVARAAEAESGEYSAGVQMFLAGETCRVVKLKPRRTKEGKKIERYTLRCEHFQHEGEIPVGDFEMDPLLRTARLHTEVDGSTVDVTWTGEGTMPEGGAGVGFYEAGAVDGGGAAGRWATAEGTILGHPVQTADEEFCFSFSFLLEGAGSYAYVGNLADGFEAPRRASDVTSEGVISRACSSRTRTAPA